MRPMSARPLSAMLLSAAAFAVSPPSFGAVFQPTQTVADQNSDRDAHRGGDSGPRSDPQPDSGTPQESPSQLAIEATRKLMAALQLLLQSLPQYGAPYMNENGDIVIPRLHPHVPRPEPKPPAPPKVPQRPGRTVL